MCQSLTLSSKGAVTVSYCSTCKQHYVWNTSYVLTFNTVQFDAFRKEIQQKIGVEEFLDFPDGESRMFLETPVSEILFTFTRVEWYDFTNSLEEAYLMREVHHLLTSGPRL